MNAEHEPSDCRNVFRRMSPIIPHNQAPSESNGIDSTNSGRSSNTFSAVARHWVLAVGGFVQHWEQAVVGEKALVIDGEFFGPEDGDDRCAAV